MSTESISKIASDFQTQLSGSISVGATSFTVQSVEDSDGNDLSDGVYCFTIDRDNTSRKEYLIGQLTSATKTVSSISSVSSQGVLTANAQKSHRIGANVIISDHSILSALSRIFNGVGTIDPASPLAYTTAPTLSSATELATKGYVDSVVTGGTVNTDRIILGSQTAGETVSAGQIVYFKSSDSRWWLADADLSATFQNVLLGVSLGSGTAGNPISDGVLIYGKCDSFTGLTATATYYLSNTAGAVATSAGTTSVIIGQAFSTTGIFVNPQYDVLNFVKSNDVSATSSANKIPLMDSDGVFPTTMIKQATFGVATLTGTTVTVTHSFGETPRYIELTIKQGGDESDGNIRVSSDCFCLYKVSGSVYATTILNSTSDYDGTGEETTWSAESSTSLAGKVYRDTGSSVALVNVTISNITSTTFDIVLASAPMSNAYAVWKTY